MEEVTLDLLHVAMNMAQAKHKVASNNIASANMENSSKLSVDFDALISALNHSTGENKSQLLNDIKSNWHQIESSALSRVDDEIKLDKETADVLLASGKYKVLTDALNRKLGLMKLSVNGGRK